MGKIGPEKNPVFSNRPKKSHSLSKDPDTGIIRKHHLQPKSYGEAIRRAAESAEENKRVTTHALRHVFATHLIREGTDIRTLQELDMLT